MQNNREIEKEIESLESQMNSVAFWNDKVKAQEVIQKIKELKAQLEGGDTLSNGGAIVNILAGAGGDDSEDWTRMLLHMYIKFFEKHNCNITVLHENKNEHGGYRNISLEINGKVNLSSLHKGAVNEASRGSLEEIKLGVYGATKNESGVHRLVRISPFNANAKRHTSFALVEVLPILPKLEFEKFKNDIKQDDIEIETSKSSGPGGQNVNKRETAVRIIHRPTNISVSVSSERSQEQNKEKAFAMLYAKLFKLAEENKKRELEGKSISKTVEIEWGSQIRNYVLHPYKLIKDLRSDYETSDIERVLERGQMDEIILSML